MTYGHADKIAAIVAGTRAAGSEKPAPPIDPALYRQDDVRPILAERDIAALYLLLKGVGVTQRTIAELTGQSQSEVSEILGGRKVLSYDLLVRIAEGLRIPRALMGLSYGEPGAYGGDSKVVTPEEVAAMLRRHVLALGTIAAFGGPAVGELLAELPDPSPTPLPARLGWVHVAKVRNLTRQFGEAGLAFGSDPEVCSTAAVGASRLLDVAGPEQVRRALMTAVAQLHVRAGWSGFDGGLYERAMFHYARALEVAAEAGDVYCQVLALNCAGLATVEHDHPDDGLKMLQVAQVKAWKMPPDHDPATIVIGEGSRRALEACAEADSATAYALLGEPEAADRALATSRELWRPTRTDPGGDLDRPAAVLQLQRGRLDAAESLAAASLRRWEGVSEVGRTQSAVVQATIHVRAGEPRGLHLAYDAVAAAARLSSFRSRQQLAPLVAALEARSGADAHQVARQAHHVATTRV